MSSDRICDYQYFLNICAESNIRSKQKKKEEDEEKRIYIFVLGVHRPLMALKIKREYLFAAFIAFYMMNGSWNFPS